MYSMNLNESLPSKPRLFALLSSFALSVSPSLQATNYRGEIICPEVCEACQESQSKASGDSVTGKNDAVDITFNLGGAVVERPDNFAALFGVAGISMDDERQRQGVQGIKSYYEDSPVWGAWSVYLRLETFQINADTFKPASLTYNHSLEMDVVDVDGVIRQVLNDFFLVDILPLPNGKEGYVLNWYPAAGVGAKIGNLYPTQGPPIKTATLSNPNQPGVYNTVDLTSEVDMDGSQRIIHYRWIFSTNASGNTTHVMETYTANPAEDNSAVKVAVDHLEFISGAPIAGVEQANQDRIRTLSVADLSESAAGFAQYGDLTVTSRVREIYTDIGGKRRLTKSTRLGSLDNDTAGLTTTWGYYDEPSNPVLHGRKKWMKRYDGFWTIWDISTSSALQVTREISPFKDGGDFVLADDGSNVDEVDQSSAAESLKIKIQSISANSITTTTQIMRRQVAKMKEDLSVIDGRRVEKMTTYSGREQFITYRGFAPFGSGTAVDSGRLLWETYRDGTGCVYSYEVLPTGDTRITKSVGAIEGDASQQAPTVYSGVKTIMTFNPYWELQGQQRFDFSPIVAEEGSEDEESEQEIALDYWMSTATDHFGRPTRVEYNGSDNDFMTTTYGCCGPILQQDRTGAVTETSYDLLRRVYKTTTRRSSGGIEIKSNTTRSDLTLTRSVSTSSGAGEDSDIISFDTSKTETNLLGQTITRWTADQNGDDSMEETQIVTSYDPVEGGRTITTTNPLTYTTISKTYRDGSQASRSGSAVTGMTYDYGVHSSRGGGLWSQQKAANSTQWTKSYRDQVGRTFQVEYPDGAMEVSTYRSSSRSAPGSYGKLGIRRDADEVAEAGKGSLTTYHYNNEGEMTKTTKAMSDDQEQITLTDYSVVADSESGIGDAYKVTTTVNDVVVSTTYRSVDGYKSKTISLGRTTSTTRSIPADGTWTVESVNADNQITKTSYSDGLMEKSEIFDNGNNLISWISYTYDGLGRRETMTDSRVGLTSFNNLTAAGQALTTVTNGGNDTTTYIYDVLGRVLTTTLPDDSKTFTSYTPRGEVRATWGSQTYPRFYAYDSLGRLLELHTWQTNPTLTQETAIPPSESAKTSWVYDPQRGWLVEKKYSGENQDGSTAADYAYTPAGRLQTRTWERGVSTTYTYDQGLLEGVDYSDSTTDLRYFYDSFGRVQIVRQGGNRHDYNYDEVNLVLNTETIEYYIDEDGVSEFVRFLDRHHDALLRSSGYELRTGNGTAATVDVATSYGYDAAGRLQHVHPSYPLPEVAANRDFTYGYSVPNSFGLIRTVTGPAHIVTNEWEDHRNVLDSKTNRSFDNLSISKYDYEVNSIGQRTSVSRSGSAMSNTDGLAWDYNNRGELVEEDFGNNDSNDPRDRVYQYDAIGNRKKSNDGTLVLPTADNYVANALNQYTTANGASLPTSPYDEDGNMTNGPLPVGGGDASLQWDAENRLIQITRADNLVIRFAYDYLGRRILKKVGSATHSYYLYDGWNLIAEYTSGDLIKSYTWGQDLSGSMQGAGGVGGLLMVSESSGNQDSNCYYPTYDGNGNVSEYLEYISDEASTEADEEQVNVVAHYEYDAFGNEITADTNGSKSADFVHRFSTKYLDSSTGLYYYGYRYYDPVTGRWPSRDPIGERGGVNLYGFVGNDTLNQCDFLGLDGYPITDYVHPGRGCAACHPVHPEIPFRPRGPSVYEHLGGGDEVEDQTPWFDYRYPNLVNEAEEQVKDEVEKRLKLLTCYQSKTEMDTDGFVVLSILTKSWAAPWVHNDLDGLGGKGMAWDDEFGDRRQSVWSGAAELGKFWFRVAPQTVRTVQGADYCHSSGNECCTGYFYTVTMEVRDTIGPHWNQKNKTRGTWNFSGRFSCCKSMNCSPDFMDDFYTDYYE